MRSRLTVSHMTETLYHDIKRRYPSFSRTGCSRAHKGSRQKSLSLPRPRQSKRLLLPTRQRQTRSSSRSKTHVLEDFTPAKMSHESVWFSRPRTYGKGSRQWYVQHYFGPLYTFENKIWHDRRAGRDTEGIRGYRNDAGE